MRAKDADTTWALVVGIDTYDAQQFRDLTGASMDAVAAVGWLRKLGVPDGQIAFHAAPNPANEAAVASLGLPNLGCTQPEIWRSIKALGNHQGSKLFVFLMGHGLYEPTGGRVFLTREATPDEPQNLGIDWYTAYFRSLSYSTQYVVLDGCLNRPYASNLRPKFEPGKPVVALPGPRDDVAQMFCSGASVGQLAEERNGRGVFTETLLKAVDPDTPHPLGVVVDLRDGLLRLDLSRIVENIVKPAFSDLQLRQQPNYRQQGDSPTPALWSLADLVPDRVATLRIRIEPDSGVAGVRRIALSSFDPDLRVTFPRSVDLEVPTTISNTLPAGVELEASCAPKAGWSSRPSAPQNLTTDEDVELVFTLTEHGADVAAPLGVVSQEATIEFLGPDGALVPAVSSEALSRIVSALSEHRFDLTFAEKPGLDVQLDSRWVDLSGQPTHDPLADAIPYTGAVHSMGDITIHPGRLGAVLTSTPEYAHLLEPLGERLVKLLTEHAFATQYPLPSDPAGARIRITPSIQPATQLDSSLSDLTDLVFDPELHDLAEIIGDRAASTGVRVSITAESAARLAGVLQQEPVLTVGELTFTLQELVADPFVPLESGPWTVQLTLPWGVWNERVAVVEGGQVDVTLPRSVGVTPLRVRALNPIHALGAQYRPGGLGIGLSLFTFGDSTVPLVAAKDRADRTPFEREDPPAPWRGVLWRTPEQADVRGPVRIETRRKSLQTTLSPTGPIAVHLAPPYRAEPLSLVPSPHWDTLISSGRLDSLSPEQVLALSQEKWSDPILGIAGAYACFAQGDDELLDVILGNLANLAWFAADVPLLRAAHDQRLGRHDAHTLSRMRDFESDLPLFRWGIEIGAAGADHYGVRTITRNLEALAPRVVPTSVWLLWESED